MNRKTTTLLIFLLIAPLTGLLAQLSPGDIAFTVFNSDNTDDFSFVALTAISGGTVINFEDNGWNNGTGTWQATSEGYVTWTAPAGGISCGTEVAITSSNSTASIATSAGTVVRNGSFSISASGDCILAHTGSQASPNFIAGINCQTTFSGTWTYDPVNPTITSDLPPALTEGVNAVAMSGTTDNWKYNCTTVNGPGLLTAINTPSDWITDDITPYTVPGGCGFSCCTPPTITSNPPNRAICNGGNTTFSIAASGATGYQWQVNQGAGFNNVSNTPPYSGVTTATLTITGATSGMNGYTYRCVASSSSCTSNSSAGTLTVSTPFTTPVSQTNVACFGGANGAASVSSASGGIGPYVYNWTPGNPTGDGTTSVTGLTAASWTCTVTDNIGCTTTATFNVTQPSAISSSVVSQTNVACNGGSNGASTITVSGGAGGYAYSWSPAPGAGQGTSSVTGLGASTYTCTITDANSCTHQQTVNITSPTPLSLTPSSQTNIACNGSSNGAASVNAASGGMGGYSYNWTPGNPTGDGTTSVTGLTVGTWSCTVTDANSCTTTVTFNITQPAAINSSVTSQTNVACNGGSNGASSITVSGGAGGYAYSWSPAPGAGQGTSSVSGLNSSTYTCTITDANSCTHQQTVNITQPAAINVTPTQTNVSCNGGNNGSITLSVSGGTMPYTYDWNNNTYTTQNLTGLTAGTYTGTLTDANGCTDGGTITITEPSAISATTTQTNVTCNGNNNGTASVAVTGGTAPYTYSWSSGGTGATENNLGQGTYTCTITDAHSCTQTETVNITEPNALSDSPSQTDVACNGNNNGSVALSVSGGTGPYTYSWSNGGTAATESSLSPGPYTCMVTDSHGCTMTESFTITEPASISVNDVQTNVSCNGGSDGSITLTVTGGTMPYTYDWNNNTYTTQNLTGLTAGTYTGTLTDAHGCTSSGTMTITEPPAIVATTSQNNVTCNGGNNGSATVTVTGGTAPYTYSWSSGGTGATENNLSQGTYTCTITDAHSCTQTETVSVTEPTAINVVSSQVDVTCNAACDGSATVSVSGGTPGYIFSWSPAGGNAATASSLCAGNYTCTITDANTCVETQTFDITEPAPVTFSLGNDTMICSPATITFCAPNTFSSYLWNTGETTDCITTDTSGCYIVSVTDGSGCPGSDTICLTVTVCTGINGISSQVFDLFPNPNDGHFTITLNGNLPEATMELYTAEGKLIDHRMIRQREDIDMSGYAKGFYFVRVNGETHKLIVQ